MSIIDRKKPASLQHQVYNALKEWFVNNFTIEDTLPTEKSISEKFNVSRGTVRTALEILVKEGLIERIPGKGSFLTQKFQINLKKYKIGVVLSDIDFFTNTIWEYNWFSHLEIINGIMSNNLNYNISTELISENHFSLEDNQKYDGFIVWPYVHKEIISLFTKPYVLLKYEIDMIQGFSLIAEDIAEKNYKNVSYIGFTAGNRIDTINSVLIKNGKKRIHPKNIFECGGSSQEAYRSCVQLIQTNPSVDCIICSTDYRAEGVIQYLHESGISIPEQISVYGFDGTKKNSSILPSISTCSFDWTYPGLFSVQTIRSLLDNQKMPEFETPKGIYIKRKSTL
jgi:DNA-binding LacI/PurR family transcriptional regulator